MTLRTIDIGPIIGAFRYDDSTHFPMKFSEGTTDDILMRKSTGDMEFISTGGSGGSGLMVGPVGGSTDNAVVRWDGTTGLNTNDSVVTISDDGAIIDTATAGNNASLSLISPAGQAAQFILNSGAAAPWTSQFADSLNGARWGMWSGITELMYLTTVGDLTIVKNFAAVDGTFSGNVTGANLNISNWDDAYTKRVDTWTSPLTFAANVADVTTGTLAGTTNQISLSATGVDRLIDSGTITLSLPQDIHTGASPTFASLTLNGALTSTGLAVVTGTGVAATLSLTSGTPGTWVVSNIDTDSNNLNFIYNLGTKATLSIAGLLTLADDLSAVTGSFSGTLGVTGLAGVGALTVAGAGIFNTGANAVDFSVRTQGIADAFKITDSTDTATFNVPVTVNGSIDATSLTATSFVSVIDPTLDSLLYLENQTDAKWSSVEFARLRSSGPGVRGGWIGLQSDAASNAANLWIVADTSTITGTTAGQSIKLSTVSNSIVLTTGTVDIVGGLTVNSANAAVDTSIYTDQATVALFLDGTANTATFNVPLSVSSDITVGVTGSLTRIGSTIRTSSLEGVSLHHDGTEGWINCIHHGTAWHDFNILCNSFNLGAGGTVGEFSVTTTEATFNVDTTIVGNLFISDTGTGTPGKILYADASDVLSFEAGGVQRVHMSVAGVVFNETHADVDFRVESDDYAYAIFLESTYSAVGLNTATPGTIGTFAYTASNHFITKVGSADSSSNIATLAIEGGRSRLVFHDSNRTVANINTVVFELNEGVFGAKLLYDNQGATPWVDHVLNLDTNNGHIAIGATNSTDAWLEVTQNNSVGAIPVASFHQVDSSEPILRFEGAGAAANKTNSLVGQAETPTPTIQGYVKVYIEDNGNRTTDAAYFMPFYSLA